MIRLFFLILFLILCVAASIDDWKDRRVSKRLAYFMIGIGAITVLLNAPHLSVYYIIASLIVVYAAHLLKIWYPFDGIICLLMMILICCTPYPEYSLLIPLIPFLMILLIKILKRESIPIVPFLSLSFGLAIVGVLVELF